MFPFPDVNAGISPTTTCIVYGLWHAVSRMPTERSERGLNRRTYLSTVAAGVTATAAVSTAGTETTTAHVSDDHYDSVVDVVEAGAANDESESVTPVVQDVIDDDTLLTVPPGRYYMDEQVRFTDFENVGLVGNDATIVPANYHDFAGPQYRLFRLGTDYAPGTVLRIANFTIDQTAADTGIRAFETYASDHLEVRNIDVVGRHDSGTWGPGLFVVTGEDGNGLVEAFRAPDGGEIVENAPGDGHVGPNGILCNQGHAGSIRFVDCELGAFPDNGLYAAGGTGRVTVEGGRYYNSGTASIRIGASRADVRGATVVVDDQPWDIGQECIRLQYGDWHVIDDVTLELERPNGEAIHVQDDVDGVTIRNSSIRMEAPAYRAIQVDAGAGDTYVEDSEIVMNDSNCAILAESGGGELGVQNVSITGDAEGFLMRHAIRCERDDAAFRNVTIRQTAGEVRRGIALLGQDSVVYDCDIETSGRGLTVKGDDAWIQSSHVNSTQNTDSIRLFESATNVRLKNNSFPDGVSDWGATNVVETGTSY